MSEAETKRGVSEAEMAVDAKGGKKRTGFAVKIVFPFFPCPSAPRDGKNVNRVDCRQKSTTNRQQPKKRVLMCVSDTD